mmetsp:Transcript_16162/g.18131  ORF Transcript_16162/g.18131 Transcript_16162/m.18131 type:complete len:364 (-) Transcript_16162:191-1282(-)
MANQFVKILAVSVLLFGTVLSASAKCDNCGEKHTTPRAFLQGIPVASTNFAWNAPTAFLEDPVSPVADVIQSCTETGNQTVFHVVQEKYELEPDCTLVPASQDPCGDEVGVDQVYLWTEEDYKGTCYTLENIAAAGVNFSSIKSLQVGPGIEKVRLLTHDHCDNIYYKDARSINLMNVAWKEVYLVHDDAVYLYSDEDFQGERWIYTETQRTNMISSSVKSAIFDDTIDGIRLYTKENMAGESWGHTNHKMNTLPTNISNEVRALYIYREVPDTWIRMYSEENFEGRIRDRSGAEDDLDDVMFGNQVKSFRLGNKVDYLVLYQEKNFDDSGINRAFREEWASLKGNKMENKMLSLDIIVPCDA